MSSSHLFFSYFLYDLQKPILCLKAAPSKAFLEDQAEREPSERERAEKERAKRELAKRQKLQSYEDFEPISISEFGLDLCFPILIRFPPKVTASKCQIEDLRERGVPEDMLSKIQHSNDNLIYMCISSHDFLIQYHRRRAWRRRRLSSLL